MTNRATSLIAYIVPFLVVAIFMPWRATSAAEFEADGLRVFAVAVFLHLALRYGMPYLWNKWGEQPGVAGVAAARQPLLRSAPWRLLRVGCVASIAVGLGSLVLANTHVFGAYPAFYLCLVGQQVVLVLAAGYIARVPERAPNTVLSLAGVAIAAVFFAWSSNIVLDAQQPPLVHKSSDDANVLYAIPVVVVAIFGLVRRLLK